MERLDELLGRIAWMNGMGEIGMGTMFGKEGWTGFAPRCTLNKSIINVDNSQTHIVLLLPMLSDP